MSEGFFSGEHSESINYRSEPETLERTKVEKEALLN